MAADIYDYPRRLRNMLALIQRDPSIPGEVKEEAERFKDQCLADGISPGRITRYLFDLRKLAGWHGGSLRGLTVVEARSLVARIGESAYAPATRRDLKITLRKYVHFLEGGEQVPASVAWIRASAGVRTLRIPEEVLTEDEILRMLRAAESLRDRAFIATLYESGCRIGEILGLRLRHVTPAPVGMVLRVDGKTGPRRIRVISSGPALTELMNNHPEGDNRDAPLWMTRLQGPLGYRSASAVLVRAARHAGVAKRIYPHLFRHSRATHLANHLTDAQMKEYFGWVQGSDMAAVYVHLSGRDVDTAILRLHGLEPEEPRKEALLSPVQCLRCGGANPAGHRFCMTCGTPITRAATAEVLRQEADREEADALLDKLIEDPEVQALLKRKIHGLADRRSGSGNRVAPKADQA